MTCAHLNKNSTQQPADLYLTTHNTHNRQTSMHPVGFEPTIVAGERSQTYALDRAATRTGQRVHNYQAKTSNINGQHMYMDSRKM